MCQVFYIHSLCPVKHSAASQGRNYPILKMRKPRLREFSKLPEVTQVVTGRVGIRLRSVQFHRLYPSHNTALFLHPCRLLLVFTKHFLCQTLCLCFIFNLEVRVFQCVDKKRGSEGSVNHQSYTTTMWILGCHLQSTCLLHSDIEPLQTSYCHLTWRNLT